MPTTSRQVLSVVSDNKLNIISNSTPKKHVLDATGSKSNLTLPSKFNSSLNIKKLSLNLKNAHTKTSTETKISNFDTIMNNHLKRKSDQVDNINSLDVSPNLKRARLLRMKLQLAYYKVKTNQTEIKTTNLKYYDKNIFNINTKSNIETDLDTKMPTTRTKITTKITTASPPLPEATTATVTKPTNRVTSISNKPILNFPLSAPPTTLAFSNLPFKAKFSSSVTSPSKFAICQVSKKNDRQLQAPPVARLLSNTSNNNVESAKEITRSQSNIYPNETTIDEGTILQNDSTSTPLLRRHSVDIIESNGTETEKHDPDSTILQTSMLVSTPIRNRVKHIKIGHTNSNSKATESIRASRYETIEYKDKEVITKRNDANIIVEYDDDEEEATRIFSSPTRERLLCTPSSTAAAKCLLQLAHR